MLLRSAAAILFAAIPQAHATDWYYVDRAKDNSSVNYIDRDGIRPNAAGNLLASMFSVGEVRDGVLAYRFEIEVDCNARRTRLIGAEAFDESRASRGMKQMETDWRPARAGSQGATLTDFVCSTGAKAAKTDSAGAALPFDAGLAMIAEGQ